MSGGGWYWMTPQGIIAAGAAYNPDYGKMAAESVAKEVAERKLVPPTTSPEEITSGNEQVSPARGTDKITSGEDQGPGVRK